MYSIYDYYGMQNDLENRYTAGKNEGTGNTRQAPSLSNAPFQPNVPMSGSQATNRYTLNPMEPQTPYNAPQDSGSTYGDPGWREGGQPAPGWVNTTRDIAMGLFGTPLTYGINKGIELGVGYLSGEKTGRETAVNTIKAGVNMLPYGKIAGALAPVVKTATTISLEPT
jgi:hypothetical protein